VRMDRVRLVAVVRGNAIGADAIDVVVGTPLGGVEVTRVARERVARAETVERPGLPPRPAGVGSPALLCRLTEELAGLEIEDPLVRGAAIAADEMPPGLQTMR